jgi:hypothetical protein
VERYLDLLRYKDRNFRLADHLENEWRKELEKEIRYCPICHEEMKPDPKTISLMCQKEDCPGEKVRYIINREGELFRIGRG